AIAGGLAGASYGGRTVFTLAVLVLQIVAVLGWLAVLDPAGSFGAFVVAMGAAVAGDLLLLRESGAEIGRLAGVFGLAVLAALVHQLSRRPRPRVTESLSGTLSAVVLVIAAASLVGLHGGRGGTQAASVGLIATGAGLLVARVVDRVARGLPSVRGGTRGWPGLVAGAALAGVIGALYGSMAPPLSSRSGLIIGLATGAVALLADLGLDLVAGALRDSALDRQRNALTPVGAFIPIVVAAPAAYVAGRILLG
ncbi:MAG TPA: hypothetical protein VNE21_07615, partial [Mycobacteriales bacterium]|nr:hypothetical protein [Mycobacteriales bacterium]